MGLFRYILGGESRRNLRKLDSMADKVLALQEKYEKFTDEELREQTSFFRTRLKSGDTLDDILYDAFAVVREAAYRVLKMRHYKVKMPVSIRNLTARLIFLLKKPKRLYLLFLRTMVAVCLKLNFRSFLKDF